MNLAMGINIARRYSRGISSSSYILYDDFDSGVDNATIVGRAAPVRPNANTWLVPLGVAVTNLGKLELRFPTLTNAIANYLLEDTDGEIGATIIIPASGTPRSGGIVFRRLGNNDFFAAMINFNEQAFRLIDVTGGVTTTLKEKAFTVVPDVPYFMRVIVDGNDFLATVDGVGSLDASSTARNTEKRFGVRGQNSAGGLPIIIDNFYVIPAPPPADAHVTIAGTPLLTSALETSVIHNHNDEIWFGDGGTEARDRAMDNLTGMIEWHHSYLISGGVPDVWLLEDEDGWTPGDEPVPNEPTNWSSLDTQLNRILAMGGKICLRVHLFEWWMKGHLQTNGTTIPATKADKFSEDGRLMTQYLPHEKLRVRKMCERYMVAPYNVRDFVLGIEYHGWQLGSTTNNNLNLTFNKLAYHDYPGSAGLNANMGYAHYHNEIVAEIEAVAAELEIGPIRIINNYVRFHTRTVPNSASVAEGHPLREQVWGTVEAKAIEALEEGIPLLDRLDALGMDFGSRNDDHETNGAATDDITNLEKFYAFPTFIRDEILTPLLMPDLPIMILEAYPRPQPNGHRLDDYAYRAMIQAVAYRWCVLAGVEQMCHWGFRGRSLGEAGGGMTEGSAMVTSIEETSGGEALPALEVVEMFNENFSAGTDIYEVTVVGSGIQGIASADQLVLINTTDDAKVVREGANTYDVAGPGYRIIER